MYKHKDRKPRSFFSSVLGLFLILCFFIIFVSTGLYFRSTQRVILKAFSDRNLTSLSQVSHMFDVLHSQLIPGLKEASYNNHTLFRLMYSENITARELLNGIEVLDDLLLSYPLVNSLYIYNGQMNFFISTSSGYEKVDDFFDKDVLEIIKNRDDKLIDRYLPRTAIAKDPYNEDLSEKNVLTLLMGSTPRDNVPLKGALISNIDVKEIQSLLNTQYGSGLDEIFIVNQRGEWICQSLDDSSVDYSNLYEQILETGQDRGVLTTEGSQLVTYQFNYRLGWYFMGVMPLDQVNREIFIAGRLILFIMIALLLISGFLSYMATRHVYRPIDSLMRIMSGKGGGETAGYSGAESRELSFIANRYRSILNEKDSLEDSLEELYDDYRIEFIRSIIRGQEYQHWEEELYDADMDFISRPLSLFLIQIDNYYRIAEEMKPEVFRTLRKSLVETIKSTLDIEDLMIVDMDIRNIVCLISGEPEEFLSLMKELQEQIRKDLSCSVSISWTNRIEREELKLSDMYLKAQSAVGAKFATGLEQLIPYDKQDMSSLIFPGDLADKMFQSMRQGNLSCALNKLEDLALILKQGSYRDFIQHIRILSYRILRYLEGKELPDIKKLLQQVRSYPETLETLQNFRAVYRDILESIHRYSDTPGRKSRAQFESIEACLNEHFRNPACCVQFIADELHFSPNYLRSIYKNFTGKSLSDALVSRRVEEACRLLVETNDPVKELYGYAGFSNYNSFFTCFKRIKGETPADYRRRRINP